MTAPRSAGAHPRPGILTAEGRAAALADDADFDAFAASLRAEAVDVAAFLEALAAKLPPALPGCVDVRRRGGLFKRTGPVSEVRVALGETELHLEAGAGGAVHGEVAHKVRGITLKSEAVDLPAWIDALVQALRAHASQSATAAEALRRFLI